MSTKTESQMNAFTTFFFKGTDIPTLSRFGRLKPFLKRNISVFDCSLYPCFKPNHHDFQRTVVIRALVFIRVEGRRFNRLCCIYPWITPILAARFVFRGSSLFPELPDDPSGATAVPETRFLACSYHLDNGSF